jgi:hypothetical protein
MPQEVREHLNWIAGYCACATDDNWRDMLHMIEEQVRRAKKTANETPAITSRAQS